MKMFIWNLFLGFLGGKFYLFLKKRSSENNSPQTPKRSNVIQYDEMGYPLRLVITKNGKQAWVDTYEQENDVVLKWK